MGQFHLAVNFKVTVHVGKDQNIEIEIFEEYKYTLNDFPTKRLFFSIRLIVCEIWRTGALPEVNCTKRHTLGANSRNMFWLPKM